MKIIDNNYQLYLSKYHFKDKYIIYIEKFNIRECIIIHDNIKVLEFDDYINVNLSINSYNNLEKLITIYCLNIILPNNLTQLKPLYIYNVYNNYCSILDIQIYPNLTKLHV